MLMQFLMCTNVVEVTNVEHLRNHLKRYNPDLLSTMFNEGNRVSFHTFDNFKARFLPYSKLTGKMSNEAFQNYYRKFLNLLEKDEVLLFYETTEVNDNLVVLYKGKNTPLLTNAHAILNFPNEQIRELFKNVGNP